MPLYKDTGTGEQWRPQCRVMHTTIVCSLGILLILEIVACERPYNQDKLLCHVSRPGSFFTVSSGTEYL